MFVARARCHYKSKHLWSPTMATSTIVVNTHRNLESIGRSFDRLNSLFVKYMTPQSNQFVYAKSSAGQNSTTKENEKEKIKSHSIFSDNVYLNVTCGLTLAGLCILILYGFAKTRQHRPRDPPMARPGGISHFLNKSAPASAAAAAAR